MEQEDSEILQFASLLVNRPLAPNEAAWVNKIASTIWSLLGQPEMASSLGKEVFHACKQALKVLMRANRFPSNFDILQFEHLHKLRHPIQCAFDSNWDTPLPAKVNETDFELHRIIMLARLAPMGAGAEWIQLETEIGSCVFVRDALDNALPCVVLNATSLDPNRPACADQVILSTSWRYCPIPSSYELAGDNFPTFRLIHGYFEICKLKNIQTPPSPPEKVLQLHDAFDHRKGGFKKHCLPPKMPDLSLTGQVRRISLLIRNNEGDTLRLLDLYSPQKDFSVTIVIKETPDTTKALGSAVLLRLGDFVVITHLKADKFRIPSFKHVPCFSATSSTQIVPVQPTHTEAETTESLKKQKKVEGQNEASTGLVDHYSGCVTRVLHSHCFELDNRYLVLAHRSTYGLATRKGAKITLRFAHRLLDSQGSTIGFGICSYGRIELLEFAPSFDPRPAYVLQELDRNNQFSLYSLPLCLFVETSRAWLVSHYQIGREHSIEDLVRFLLDQEAVEAISGRFSLLRPSDPLHEWFGHDMTKYGRNLGCQAMGRIEGEEYPSIMTIDELLLAINHEPSLRMTKTRFWTYSLINPMTYLKQNRRVIVGRLTDRKRGDWSPPSNHLWFESEIDGVQVPIVVPGVHLRHLYVPCCLSSFTVVRECTIAHWGADYGKKLEHNIPFDFYIVCELEQIRFASECVDYSAENVLGGWIINLMRKETPRYQSFEWASSLFYNLECEAISASEGLKQGTGGHFLRMTIWIKNDKVEQHIWPLLHQNGTYMITGITRNKADSDRKRFGGGGRGEGGNNAANVNRFVVEGQLSIVEIPLQQDPFRRSLGNGMKTILEQREKLEVEELASLRDCLVPKKPGKDKEHRTINVRALIISRRQDPLLTTKDNKENPVAARFLPGEPREWRCNSGQITLELRALDSPDRINAFIEPHKMNLPIGLVPGMIVKLSFVQLKLEKKFSDIRFVPGSSIEVIGFDTTLLDFLNPLNQNSRTFGALALRPDALAAGFYLFDSGFKASLLRASSLGPLLVESIPWLEYSIPYRHFIDIPSRGLNKQVFRTRAVLKKVFKLLFETRCVSCRRISRRGICSYGCSETSMEMYAEMRASFNDGTGSAKISVQGSHLVFSLLATSHNTRSLVTSVVERMGSLRIEDNEVHIPKVTSLADAEMEAEDSPSDSINNGPQAHEEAGQSFSHDSTHAFSLSTEEIVSIKSLVARIAGQIVEPVILITSHFNTTNEELLALNDLPYIASRKNNATADADTSIGNKLSIPTPNLDLIWVCKAAVHIKSECSNALQKLKTLAPDLMK